MSTKRERVDMTKDNILKSIIVFAVPILISNIFQQLYNTMDAVLVGNLLGEVSLAAIGASSAIYDVLIGFAIGVGNGLGIVVARSYGAKDETLLKKSVGGAIVIAGLLSLVIMIIASFSLPFLLRVLNTPENIMDEALSYIRLVTMFVGVALAYNLCAGLLRATGDSKASLIFLIISSVSNVVFDYFLLTYFKLGLTGSAIGTIMAQTLSFVLCIIYINKKAPILIPKKKHFKFDKKLYADLASQGFSMGLMMAVVFTGTFILQKAINGFGYLTIAGHVAARKINSLFIMPCGTVSATISTFVSQNRGAGEKERIKKGVKIGVGLVVIWGIIATIIMALFSRNFIAFVSGSNEAVVLENGSKYLMINSPFYAVAGTLFIMRHSIQGLGGKIIPIISSIIELIGKILFAWIFIPRLDYLGVIICEPIIWCIMCIFLFISYIRHPFLKKNKTKKPVTV